MIINNILYVGEHRIEDVLLSSDQSTLETIASGEVLRGNHGDNSTVQSSEQQNLAVIGG